MEDKLLRTQGLISSSTKLKLTSIKVVVLGIGGVGGIIVEGLLRLGVKHLVLIDGDTVEASNLNRQILYLEHDINSFKVVAAKKRGNNIFSDCHIDTIAEYITEENIDGIFSLHPDFIFDAIDDLKIKAKVIKKAQEQNIEIISSLGMGRRINATMIHTGNYLSATSDPFKKALSKFLTEEKVDLNKLNVVYSCEAAAPAEKDFISSLFMVPNAAGLAMLSYFIETIK